MRCAGIPAYDVQRVKSLLTFGTFYRIFKNISDKNLNVELYQPIQLSSPLFSGIVPNVY